MRRGPFVTLVAGVGLLASVAGCKGGAASDAKSSALSNAGETWCPEHFEPGPSDTCFAIPEKAGKDTPVLVYLHGMYQGHGSPEEWAAVSIALQRGFAVVIPRGKRGLCAWRAEFKDHYCWPQDAEDVQAMKSVVGEWERVLWQVDALLEGGSHKRYVLGSSNGGFFASYLATHTLFPGQAYAVVNGGPMGVPAAKAKPVPVMLLASPDGETASTMKELHETLSKGSWTHGFCPRPGGTSLTADDVEAAVRFFKHDADGSLKAQSGTYPCDGTGGPNARR
jgi:poly(3-hydroxybutyrate) depolymerase